MGGFMGKIDAVKWSQRFVLSVLACAFLVFLFFIFKIVLAEGLSGVLRTAIGAAFLAAFLSAFWKALYSEWDAIKTVDE